MAAVRLSLADRLPQQQEEPNDGWTRESRRVAHPPAGSAPARKRELPPAAAAADRPQVARSCSATNVRGVAPMAAATGRSSSASAIRRGAPWGAGPGGRRPSGPPPGSAAASASQVEALLARLEELESHVSDSSAAEEELKAVNLALMDRLAAFQRTNEENVDVAERELGSMHASLQQERAARSEAEAAAEEAYMQLTEQKQHAESVAISAQSAEEEAAQERRQADELRANLERLAQSERL